jgi:FixJ family two-component response regulator
MTRRPQARYFLIGMRGPVLVLDDDASVVNLVAEILTEEGFAVTRLTAVRPEALRAEVASLEPGVVLLGGGDPLSYGSSWILAVWLHEREWPVPTIMFTAHSRDLVEAQLGVSERSRRAGFSGFISKPFDVQVLIDTVTRVMGSGLGVGLDALPDAPEPAAAGTPQPPCSLLMTR